MNDQYVVLLIDQGVLAIGTKTSYGMDVTYFAEEIEFTEALEPDEYIQLGYYEPFN